MHARLSWPSLTNQSEETFQKVHSAHPISDSCIVLLKLMNKVLSWLVCFSNRIQPWNSWNGLSIILRAVGSHFHHPCNDYPPSRLFGIYAYVHPTAKIRGLSSKYVLRTIFLCNTCLAFLSHMKLWNIISEMNPSDEIYE